MVICFDSTAEGKRALDALMQSGQFRDVSEAVSMALVNYEVIQKAVTQGSPVTFEKTANRAPAETIHPARTTERPTKTISGVPEIPGVFLLTNTTLEGLNLPEVAVANVAEVPPARWLFGQYNKFLPAKAACRGLLNLLDKSRGGVPLAQGAETISTAAWELGDYLSVLDQRSNRAREDAFASAFPTSAGSGAASRIRFANQFVGDLRQPKQPDSEPRETKFNGFPAALKFLFCADGRSPLLHLTRPGADFALLENPILDGAGQVPHRKFSDAETAFLLAHVLRCVPEEASAYLSVIEGIQQGASTPDALDEYLCGKFRLVVAAKATDNTQITQTFLTTQRTGAISRMVDLGLLAREKTGLRVTYLVTPSGTNFQNQTK